VTIRRKHEPVDLPDRFKPQPPRAKPRYSRLIDGDWHMIVGYRTVAALIPLEPDLDPELHGLLLGIPSGVLGEGDEHGASGFDGACFECSLNVRL
jgi:hypothetical protein